MTDIEHINFRIRKAEEYLKSIGLKPKTMYYYGNKSDSFMEAAAIMDETSYTNHQKSLYVNRHDAIMFNSHFVINLETGEWIKERCPLPITPAERVLYEQK